MKGKLLQKNFTLEGENFGDIYLVNTKRYFHIEIRTQENYDKIEDNKSIADSFTQLKIYGQHDFENGCYFTLTIFDNVKRRVKVTYKLNPYDLSIISRKESKWIMCKAHKEEYSGYCYNCDWLSCYKHKDLWKISSEIPYCLSCKEEKPAEKNFDENYNNYTIKRNEEAIEKYNRLTQEG